MGQIVIPTAAEESMTDKSEKYHEFLDKLEMISLLYNSKSIHIIYP